MKEKNIIKCKLCNSYNCRVIFTPPQKNKQPVDKNDFAPTSSGFGIFYKLARCDDCNVVFSIIDEEVSKIDGCYQDAEDNLYISQRFERQKYFNNLLSEIKNLVPNYNAKLLDIGCSYGIFLKLAQERGFHVFGIEKNKKAYKFCTGELGLDVRCDDIGRARFPDEYFDVITALEVIEHLDSPSEFIVQAKKMLKPGGILFLVTPDIESFSSKLLGWKWWSYRKMHLTYFSKKVLYSFLKSSGFKVLQGMPYIKTFKIEYILYQLSNYNKALYKLVSKFCKIFRLNDKLISLSFGDIAIISKNEF